MRTNNIYQKILDSMIDRTSFRMLDRRASGRSVYIKLSQSHFAEIKLADETSREYHSIEMTVFGTANATKITNKIYLNDIDTSGCHILINRDNDDFSWVTKAFDESEGKRTYSDDIDKSSLNIIAENIENFLYNFK